MSDIPISPHTALPLYRKRFCPEEFICLKDDILLFENEELLLTKWEALHPKKTLSYGYSAYFPKQGFKISHFHSTVGKPMFWYCDIVRHDPHPDGGTVYTDLLIDVIVYPDGNVRVVDLDEAADALSDGLITEELLTDALRKADKLLSVIYSGHFPLLTKPVSDAEEGILPDSDWHYPL